MRSLTARQVEEILSANGYEFRRMKGSHAIWYSPVRRHAVPVPRHGGLQRAPLLVEVRVSIAS